MGRRIGSQVQTFAGAVLDRAAVVRHDPDRAAALLSQPGARAVAASEVGVVVQGATLARRSLADDAVAGLVRAGGPVLLGLESSGPLFAVELGAVAPPPAAFSGGEVIGLRDAGARLPQAEGGLAAYLTALLGWHRRNRFCPNCGTPTTVSEIGLARACPACREVHFPRTDPVVIMLVEHGDRLLLGRRSGWPPGRFSVLAGFVGPAETPEEAVIREVCEEAGIDAYAPRYVASQPWPFPASLMLGFEARADGGEPRVGDRELEEVGWFTRAEVHAAAAGAGALQLPPPISIARSLIDRWAARGGITAAAG